MGATDYDDYIEEINIRSFDLGPNVVLLPSYSQNNYTQLVKERFSAHNPTDDRESPNYLLKSFSWNIWVGPLPVNIMPIAGGHENQWHLPKEGSELGRVVKLTCLKEAYFYEWIYNIAGTSLTFHNKLFDCTGSSLKSLKCKSINKIKNTKTQSKSILKKDRYDTNSLNKFSEVSLINSDSISFASAIIKYLPTCYNMCIDDNLAAITLQNVTYEMIRPVVMDLKMGTRLYGNDCKDQGTIQIKEEKATRRSSRTHGFHISGMYVWDKKKRLASFFPEALAHATNNDRLLLIAFEKFFDNLTGKELKDLISKFVSSLSELRNLFINHKLFVFHGSSLLFAYDSANHSSFSTAGVYMIDFAHVSLSDNIDNGYIKGLDNLIRLLITYSNNS